MRNFILGTDWWTDCDDILALRILTRSVKNAKINLIGVGINACMEYSAASVDGFLQLDGLTDVPVGIDVEATDFNGIPTGYQEYLAQYAKKYKNNSEAENAVSLYRRLLASSDSPVEILEIGFLQVFASLLESQPDEYSPLNGIELVKQKVKKVWVMAGKWNEENGVEHNFANNNRSRLGADVFCKKCPVPITFLGFEIGEDVITGGEVLKPDDHLYKAMCLHGSKDGRSSWDPMLVMLAVIGDEEKAGYNTVSGTASVNIETGANCFEPSNDGLHKYVIRNFDTDYYKNQINQIIS